MIALSDRWGTLLRDQPETGMGYWVVSVVLRDGRRFDRAVIVGGILTQVYGLSDIPFTEADIADLIVTHDKWNFQSAQP